MPLTFSLLYKSSSGTLFLGDGETLLSLCRWDQDGRSSSSVFPTGIIGTQQSLHNIRHGVAIGPKRPISLYMSYSQEDEALKQEFENYLMNLHQAQLISGWIERQVQPGINWLQVIDPQLETAQILLLLLSPSLLASGYCSGAEFREAFEERRQKGEMRVIPILLHRVDLTGHPLASIQCLPRTARPVSFWPNRTEAWWDVSQGIREVILSNQLGDV